MKILKKISLILIINFVIGCLGQPSYFDCEKQRKEFDRCFLTYALACISINAKEMNTSSACGIYGPVLGSFGCQAIDPRCY